MAYDHALAERIREIVATKRGVTEKEMFGGLAFLDEGRMFVGIIGKDLMARVGPEGHDDALRAPHVRPMDFTGRPMKGYVYVSPAGVAEDGALADWIGAAHRFAKTLPIKAPKPARPAKPPRPARTATPAKSPPTPRRSDTRSASRSRGTRPR